MCKVMNCNDTHKRCVVMDWIIKFSNYRLTDMAVLQKCRSYMYNIMLNIQETFYPIHMMLHCP